MSTGFSFSPAKIPETKKNSKGYNCLFVMGEGEQERGKEQNLKHTVKV